MHPSKVSFSYFPHFFLTKWLSHFLRQSQIPAIRIVHNMSNDNDEKVPNKEGEQVVGENVEEDEGMS